MLRHITPIAREQFKYEEMESVANSKKCWQNCSNPDYVLCSICNGHGWYYDPNDPPDPYEGNKLRSTIDCKHCNTLGISLKQSCRDAFAIRYSNYVAACETNNQKWQLAVDIKNLIQSKFIGIAYQRLDKIRNLSLDEILTIL